MNPKKVSSYRFSEEVVNLVKSASGLTDLSEAQVLERCVVEKVVEVVSKNIRLKHLLQDPEAIAAFAKEVAAMKPNSKKTADDVGVSSAKKLLKHVKDHSSEESPA